MQNCRNRFVRYGVIASGRKTRNIFLYYIVGSLQSTVPNIETTLKIFLTTPITNASGERSFFITSISHNVLTNLSLMFIENDVVNALDYDNVITKFASKKSRKGLLYSIILNKYQPERTLLYFSRAEEVYILQLYNYIEY